jgi:protein-ribulosamine 3-kinase
MTDRPTFQLIAREISVRISARCRPVPERSVSGGSINECYLWHSDAGPMFVKVAPSALLSMLEAEASGLQELAAAHAVRVPGVLGVGHARESAFLALEWIETGAPNRDSERKLGERLAAQHRITAREFGWHRDNTIGRTPQHNGWMSDWTEFFRERRLRYQLELAARSGFEELVEPGGRLLESVGKVLAGHEVQPSLLHGDLWGGNWLVDSRGEPVIFDPAVYYGDPEADLAMTHLFGGFGRPFYEAYERAVAAGGFRQSDKGLETRFELYNLYHVLNHANLFCGGYAAQARAMIEGLLAQLR